MTGVADQLLTKIGREQDLPKGRGIWYKGTSVQKEPVTLIGGRQGKSQLRLRLIPELACLSEEDSKADGGVLVGFAVDAPHGVRSLQCDTAS